MKYNYKITIDNYKPTVLDFFKSFYLGNEKLKALKNHIWINDLPCDMTSGLELDDVLTIDDQKGLDIKPLNVRIDILYEDDNLLIINKPCYCHIHSDGNKNTENTLANMVAAYYVRKGLDMPVRYIHRLDYETTGIIIFAKDPLTMSALSSELENHSLRRDYLAFVEGIISNDIIIDKPIGRNRHNSQKYLISKTGKKAITICHPIGQYKNKSLVRLTLKTGRTHQIRVHMTSIGHHLLGDMLYGGNIKYIKRVALHSYYVSFINPVTKKKIELTSKLPTDMEKIKAK